MGIGCTQKHVEVLTAGVREEVSGQPPDCGQTLQLSHSCRVVSFTFFPQKGCKIICHHFTTCCDSRLVKCVCGEHLCVILTVAGAVVHAALLRMSLQSALEAMLPELWEPGVSQVGVRLQVQVIIVEPGHIS